MAVTQKVKEAEITEQDSLLLTRNLIRIAIFNISYIRGLFPEKYFNDKSVPALEMKIKKLMPMDAESRRLIDWMEKGVYDALQKKYLKTLLFCVCEGIEGPMIEEYAFSFSYSDSESQEVSMNINRIGNRKQGATFKSNATPDISPNQMRSSACKMVRTLVQLMRTLDRMPEERTILMKLFYYEDVTPIDYEPPFFRCCSEQEAYNAWAKNPLKMEVGNVNSKHFVLALKVKSILDPCEDENEDIQEGEDVSLGADSAQMDGSSDSESEVNHSQREEQYIVAPAVKQKASEDNDMVDEDDTQDEEEDENQLIRVRQWIDSHHIDTFELTDVLSHFPDISVTLTEDIMEKLVKEGILSRAGRDIYKISKQKALDPNIETVKEEMDVQEDLIVDKPEMRMDEDSLYMKALYHALPMDYITVAKLQTKLEGEANKTTVRKLIDKMAHDGYVEGRGKPKLGKRVIRSELTNKKLVEVQSALDNKTSAMEISSPNDISNGTEHRDMSTCGGLHSVGSDLTRTHGRSEIHQDGTIMNEQTKNRDDEVTLMDKTEPVASRESAVPGHKRNGRITRCIEDDNNSCRSSQEKRFRKTSTVQDPILQNLKRQKSQVA